MRRKMIRMLEKEKDDPDKGKNEDLLKSIEWERRK
jgi:hypothetical protein